MPLVKRQCRRVIHGGFKNHRVAVQGTQALLGPSQQLRSSARPASAGQNVYGNDVSGTAASRFGNNKSHSHCPRPGLLDRPTQCASLAHFGRIRHQGKRAGPLQIRGEFHAAVRNPWRKALLINAPQDLELFGPEVSQGELHGFIVVGKPVCAPVGAGPTRAGAAPTKRRRNLLRYLRHKS